MELIVGNLLGFILGIFASWLFMYLVVFVKPRIDISDNIAYSPKEDVFKIRVINKGRRQALDIQLAMTVIKLINIKEKPRRKVIYRAKFKSDTISALAPIQEWEKDIWGLSVAAVLTVQEAGKIMDLLKSTDGEERRLMLTLAATDGTSNTKYVKRLTYRLEDIKEGNFLATKEFKIVDLQGNSNAKDEIEETA